MQQAWSNLDTLWAAYLVGMGTRALHSHSPLLGCSAPCIQTATDHTTRGNTVSLQISAAAISVLHCVFSRLDSNGWVLDVWVHFASHFMKQHTIGHAPCKHKHWCRANKALSLAPVASHSPLWQGDSWVAWRDKAWFLVWLSVILSRTKHDFWSPRAKSIDLSQIALRNVTHLTAHAMWGRRGTLICSNQVTADVAARQGDHCGIEFDGKARVHQPCSVHSEQRRQWSARCCYLPWSRLQRRILTARQVICFERKPLFAHCVPACVCIPACVSKEGVPRAQAHV